MAENRPVSTVQSDYATAPPSLYPVDNAPLDPPRASYFNPGPSINESFRDSVVAPSATGLENDKEGVTPAHSTALLPVAADKDSEAAPWQPAPSTRPFYRRPIWLVIALGALVAVILAVILPVYFTVIHKSNGNRSSINKPGSSSATASSTGPSSPSPTKTPSNAITGGDGSTITMKDGTEFIYNNSFGGSCEFCFSAFIRVFPYGRFMGAAWYFASQESCMLLWVRSQCLLPIEGPRCGSLGGVPGESLTR